MEGNLRLPPLSLRSTILPLIGIFLISFLLHRFFVYPPKDFPRGEVVTIAEGALISEIAHDLVEKQVVRSALVFEFLLRLAKFSGVIVAGDYVFDKPNNTLVVARRLAYGDYGISSVKLTIPEGTTVSRIATLLSELIPGFDTEAFASLANPYEGYLFPDTYILQPTWSPDRIIRVMEKRFYSATADLGPLLKESGRTMEQIVIMASLLEREASKTEDRRMIAGILWKRLDHSMPLQVDAVFPYIIGKNTFELSRTDLATSSPYNTYRYRGLPIGPIGNPGLDSLTAALTPVDSDYFFYLSDKDGEFHYAVDFDGHKKNRGLYLP